MKSFTSALSSKKIVAATALVVLGSFFMVPAQAMAQSYGSTGYGSKTSSSYSTTGYGSKTSSSYGTTGYGSKTSSGYGSTGYGSKTSSSYGSTGYGSQTASDYNSTGFGSKTSTSYGTTGFGSKTSSSYGSTGYGPKTSSSYGTPVIDKVVASYTPSSQGTPTVDKVVASYTPEVNKKTSSYKPYTYKTPTYTTPTYKPSTTYKTASYTPTKYKTYESYSTPTYKSTSYTPSSYSYTPYSTPDTSKNIKNFDLDLDVNVNKQYNVSTSNPVVTPSCSIWANPTNVSYNGSSTVVWNSNNTTHATLTNAGSVSTNGSRSFHNLTSTKTYTLTVTSNTGHTNTCQTTVYVEQVQHQAPSCTLTINPSNIQSGNTATMHWSANNATSASIDSLGSVSTNGSTTIAPNTSKTYTMTVWNSQGQSNTCTGHVNVTSQPSNNLWCTISAHPSAIGSNGSSTLTWQSNGATSAWLSDGLGYVNPNGSLTVRPENTRTYTLTVQDSQGHTQTCTTTLGVTGNPYISLNAVPYTGFDFGPVGNALFWLGLVLFSAGAAYVALAYRRDVLDFFTGRRSRGTEHDEATVLSERIVNENPATPAPQEESDRAHGGDAMQLVTDGDMPRLVITRSANPFNLPN